jgi:hypothetical protein
MWILSCKGMSGKNTNKKAKENYMANTPVRNYRLYIGFPRDPDDDVNHLSLDVEDALLNHPVFTKLPVSLTDLETQRTAFEASTTDARKGGTDRTRAKVAAKLVLTDSLVKIALYCQGEARHDLNTLLSSGFEVDSTNRASGPLDTPSIKDIQNNVSGQLTVRGNGVLNGRMYQVQASTDGGKTYTDMGNFNGARLMVLTPTVPGTTYTVQFCALGGSTGQSAWSNPVAIMST